MYLIKRTGELFANRKKIKDFLGASRFNKYLKTGEALYIDDELLSKLNKYSMLKNECHSIRSIE